jgi:hypothetical protein
MLSPGLLKEWNGFKFLYTEAEKLTMYFHPDTPLPVWHQYGREAQRLLSDISAAERSETAFDGKQKIYALGISVLFSQVSSILLDSLPPRRNVKLSKKQSAEKLQGLYSREHNILRCQTPGLCILLSLEISHSALRACGSREGEEKAHF